MKKLIVLLVLCYASNLWSQSCGAVTDFDENFDTAITPDLPTCWSEILDNGTTQYAIINTTQWNSFTAPNGVEMYNDNSPATSNMILVSPMVSNLNAGTHWLRFYASNSTSTQDIEVGTVSDPADGSTFTPIETVDITNEWNEYSVDFTNYTGTDEYIAIRRLSTTAYTYVNLDNFVWEEKPFCLPPSNITVTNMGSDSFTISWDAFENASGDYEYLVVFEGVDPEAATPLAAGAIPGTTVDVTGLSPATSYAVHVRSNCGAGEGFSNWSHPLIVLTDCVAVTDFYEDFDAATNMELPVCWSFLIDGAVDGANVNINEWNGINGSNAVDLYNSDSEETAQIVLIAPKVSNLSNGSHWLRFSAMTFNPSQDIIVGTMSNPTDISTFTEIQTVDINSIWNEYTVDFTDYTGTDEFIAIKRLSTVEYTDVYIDNVAWEQVPVCVYPTYVEIEVATIDGGSFSWEEIGSTPSNGYDWVVVLEDGDPDDINDIIASGTSMAAAADVTGLNSGTTYYFYVKANCGADGFSLWSQVIRFSTAYFCGDDFYDTGGIDGAYEGNSDLTWNIVPDDPSEFAQITFTMVDVEPNYDYLRVYDGPNSSFPQLSEVEDGVVEPIIFSASVPGQPLTITFTSDGAGQYTGWEAVVSCVTCVAPTGINLTNVTAYSATVNWSLQSGATDYDYVIVNSGDDPNDSNTVEVASGTTTNTSVDLSALTPATYYDVYIRTDCGTNGESSWSNPVELLTDCAIVTEFNEEFDNVQTPEIPVCWSVLLDNGADEWATVTTINWDSYSVPNNISMYNSVSPETANIMLVAPIVSNLNAGTHWLRFYARNTLEGEDLQIGTLSDPLDGSTFTVLETVDVTADWDEFHVDFSSYTGTDQYIALRRFNTQFYTNVYIDNVVWEQIPACISPDDLEAVEIFEDGITFLWEGTDNAEGYNYIVVAQGGDPEDDTQILSSGTATTTEFTINGLDPGINYDLYVEADCGVSDGLSVLSLPLAFRTSCQSPSGLHVINTDFEEIEFGWDVASGTLGYEYVVVLSGMLVTPANYIAVGTISSASQESIIVENLEMGQQYDLYFRIVCETNFVGGWSQVPFETLGVEKNYIEGFTFYPNPVKNELKLQAKNSIDNVEVLNLLGQTIIKENPHLLNYTLNMENLSAGTYFVKVVVGGQAGSFKILKE